MSHDPKVVGSNLCWVLGYSNYVIKMWNTSSSFFPLNQRASNLCHWLWLCILTRPVPSVPHGDNHYCDIFWRLGSNAVSCHNLIVCVVQATKMLLRKVALSEKRIEVSPIQKCHFISFKKVFLIKLFGSNKNPKPQKTQGPQNYVWFFSPRITCWIISGANGCTTSPRRGWFSSSCEATK